MKDHIHIEWWRVHPTDRKIRPEDQQDIDDYVWIHLPDQIKQGFTEGGLYLVVGNNTYRGYWRFVRVH